MTKNRVLIDTSIWVEYLKAKNLGAVQSVRDLISARRAVLCGIVLSELVAGIRSASEKDILRYYLSALEYAEMSASTWILAGELSATLRGRGKSIPTTDVILAALAVERGDELFSNDSHFDRIPTLKRFAPESP